MSGVKDRKEDGTAPAETWSEATVPSRMPAIVQRVYGGPDVLTLKEVATPIPGPGAVQMRVEASSLNVYDLHMITGLPYLARAVAGWKTPKHLIPGADAAGVVTAVGPGVDGFAPGDRVFGDIGRGAFARYAVADESRLASLPEGVTFEQGAAAPLAGLTALQGLRDVGRLGRGGRVLINGATGGVGSHAVQLARALGASRIAAVCSTSKVEMVRSLGADDVIDYARRDFTETERGYDLLFDNVGDRPWSQTRRVLTDGGINVTITGPKHRWLGPFRHLLARRIMSVAGSRRFTWFTAQVRKADLITLGDLMVSGEFSPVVERTYPLDRVADALCYLADGHARGKLVISA